MVNKTCRNNTFQIKITFFVIPRSETTTYLLLNAYLQNVFFSYTLFRLRLCKTVKSFFQNESHKIQVSKQKFLISPQHISPLSEQDVQRQGP